MTDLPTTITLNIGNAVPHGSEKDSDRIIELWKVIGSNFNEADFIACSPLHDKALPCKVSLDCSGLIDRLETARKAGSFDQYRQESLDNPVADLSANLVFTINGASKFPDSDLHEIAALFTQQLVLASNLVIPGSMQVLNASFEGSGGRCYEMLSYDSQLFYGVRRFLKDTGGLSLTKLEFGQVWSWLDSCEVSQTRTALKTINKALFSLLKVAEIRQEYSARGVLIVMYILRVLLDCESGANLVKLRNRVKSVMGGIPEAADRFRDLFEVKDKMFFGDQPVKRTTLIRHDLSQELHEELGYHNTAFITGLSLAHVLLNRLIAENSQKIAFSESFEFV